MLLTDIALYFSIIFLQIGDWATTRFFVSVEGVNGEANPFAREEMARSGNVTWKLLVKKVLFGIVSIIIIITMPNSFEYMFGVAMWAFLYVVLNNASVILGRWYMLYSGIKYTRANERTSSELAESNANYAFRDLALCLFTVSIATWIYLNTGRTFLFSAALILFLLCIMQLISANEYKKRSLNTSVSRL